MLKEAFFAVAASREPKMDRVRPAMLIAALVVDVGRRPPRRYTGVLHVIDLFSQYTWAIPVVTVGSASNTAAALKFLKSCFFLRGREIFEILVFF